MSPIHLADQRLRAEQAVIACEPRELGYRVRPPGLWRQALSMPQPLELLGCWGFGCSYLVAASRCGAPECLASRGYRFSVPRFSLARPARLFRTSLRLTQYIIATP